jgi:soluble lytic murein transglycosylase-like protein
LLLVALVAQPATLALADMFQFTDRSGVVHFTNVEPASGGWKRLYHDSRSEDGYPAGGGGLGRGERRLADPERTRRYDAHIEEAAQLYQLPSAFIRAVVMVESNFYADAVSSTGAIGLMQLMPSTAANMGVTDAFDPRQNVLGGTRFLRVLANKFNGNLMLTVAAYNAGEGAVTKYRGVPPYAETRRYVRKVLQNYYELRSQSRALAVR